VRQRRSDRRCRRATRPGRDRRDQGPRRLSPRVHARDRAAVARLRERKTREESPSR
jgi:hypothetical protein